MPFALRANPTPERPVPSWFRFHTIIGPCATALESQRALFHSAEDAMNTNAFKHPLSFYEPFEVPDGAPGDFNWNQG